MNIRPAPLREAYQIELKKRPIIEASLRLSGAVVTRSAKGSGSAVHLIHRGAVPLPLKGKDNTHSIIEAPFSGAAMYRSIFEV